MAWKKSGLSVRGKPAVKNVKHISDSKIDFSDIPESTDEELHRAKRIGRPLLGKHPKQMVAIRIDPALLMKLRKMAVKQSLPYQSLIHRLLEKAAKAA